MAQNQKLLFKLKNLSSEEIEPFDENKWYQLTLFELSKKVEQKVLKKPRRKK